MKNGYGYGENLDSQFYQEFYVMDLQHQHQQHQFHQEEILLSPQQQDATMRLNQLRNLTPQLNSANLSFHETALGTRDLSAKYTDDEDINLQFDNILDQQSESSPDKVFIRMDNNNSRFEKSMDIDQKKKRTRARGEALDILKSEFETNPNPTSKRRKVLSDLTGLSEKKVRIWFQNKRAKVRKSDKLGKPDGGDSESISLAQYGSPYGSSMNNDTVSTFFDRIPFNTNKNYYFIDICSITVGSWNRMKSGSLRQNSLPVVKYLSNLSPNSINELMSDTTDLIVLMSKKNYEINYFFSAMADNTRILFRVFFPINTVANCSLVLQTDDIITTDTDGDRADNSFKFGELKLFLSKPPNFAVHFLDQNDNQSPNQWSICEDFSEGRQVSDAFINGSNIPHVLKGVQDSLRYINSLILDYNSTHHQPVQQSVISRQLVGMNMPAQQLQQNTNIQSSGAFFFDNRGAPGIINPNASDIHYSIMDNSFMNQNTLPMNLSMPTSSDNLAKLNDVHQVNTPDFFRSPSELHNNDNINNNKE